MTAAQQQISKPERVAAWIDAHACPEPTIVNIDGTLTVASVVTAGGKAWVERDTIPATYSAARDLLGY